MRASLPTALMTILLLSNPALAADDACEADVTSVMTVTADAIPTSGSSGLFKALANGAAQPAVSTVTVVPLPLTTASGLFFSGAASGSGSGFAQPSGGLMNTTLGSGPSTTVVTTLVKLTSTATVSSIPFFSIQTTASLPLPTNSISSIVSSSTHSTSIKTLATSKVRVKSKSWTKSSIKISESTSSVASTTHSKSASTSASAPASASASIASSLLSSAAAAANSSSGSEIPFLRGVNLGGWLVLESWMDGDLFSGDFADATDQYSFDSIPGAKAALEEHWDTFFTESDIADLAATGINALRIPIGFWAYDNANTPYISGADKYMDLAITWARKYGMKVWVDCHGSPGSQNGFQNSGHANVNDWQLDDNLQRSIEVLKIMGAKYGSMHYSDVVVGLELTNEPISYDNNNFGTTQSWAQEAYAAVKSVVHNPDLVIVMHDSFQTPLAWLGIGEFLNGLLSGKKTFGIDTHKYGLYSDKELSLTQAQHIDEVCGTWPTVLAPSTKIMPTYVGEWSATTEICVNPDGSTTAGTSCSVDGCQCQSAGFDQWNDNMIDVVGKFVEAQLDVFEENTNGYFMWAAKGPGGWGFLNGIEKGIVPNPVTSRNHKSQCGSGSKRREVRGSLGVEGEAW